jgi:hypothetical protein
VQLLSPLALLWLAAIPLLVWLWRLAATRKQLRVPSLIPFERLLSRPAKRRAHLVVTTLFWLQLGVLVGAIAALARPVLLRPRGKTVLAILDTSASMGAAAQGQSSFEQAKRALLSSLGRRPSGDQIFVMVTAPAGPLMKEPAADRGEIAQLINSQRVSHLGGNLSTAAHVGQTLLGHEPDVIVVATDEPRPSGALPESVEWISVGSPAPNTAIVGLDAQGPLCGAETSRLVSTVHNFSDSQASVQVTATQRGRTLASATLELEPGARRSAVLEMPEDAEGWAEVTIDAQQDALEVDNHAWAQLRPAAAVPIVIDSQDEQFVGAVSRWLGACEALTWSAGTPADGGAGIVITDHEPGVAAAGTMVFRASGAEPMRSYWTTADGHPISSYLPAVSVVDAAVSLAPDDQAGQPVVYTIRQGERLPVISATEIEGRRIVWMHLAPAGSTDSTPVILAFLNSVRWLMARTEGYATGEPMVIGGLSPGAATLLRPDGARERVQIDGTSLAYDDASVAGLYRVEQGTTERVTAANFIDPLESDVMRRASTWQHPAPMPQAAPALRRAAHPLTNVLLVVALALLGVEWWWYSRKGRRELARAQPG